VEADRHPCGARNGLRILNATRRMPDNLMHERVAVSSMSRLSLSIALLLTTPGCNGGHERAAVTGKVTFDGQPVKTGQIVFEPAGSGRLGIAQIADGVYSMPHQQGPSAGKYIVRITANRPTGQKRNAGSRGENQSSYDVVEQFIPARYNDRSELEIEIGGEPEIKRDFDLSSAAQ
jgi:hypothetical protein